MSGKTATDYARLLELAGVAPTVPIPKTTTIYPNGMSFKVQFDNCCPTYCICPLFGTGSASGTYVKLWYVVEDATLMTGLSATHYIDQPMKICLDQLKKVLKNHPLRLARTHMQILASKVKKQINKLPDRSLAKKLSVAPIPETYPHADDKVYLELKRDNLASAYYVMFIREYKPDNTIGLVNFVYGVEKADSYSHLSVQLSATNHKFNDWFSNHPTILAN
jgi:hypothetical protein